MSSSSMTVSGSQRGAAGSCGSRSLTASMLSLCIATISFVSLVGYFPIVRIDHYMYLLQCQIHVSKTMFCILLYVFTSNTTRRKLPPAQMSKDCCTAVVASNKHSAVSSLVKWGVYGRRVILLFVFLKKVFAIPPDIERRRNIFFGISVDCQDINRINGVQSYFTFRV